jgi:ATP-dependent 26S proteasome regulatory subunit
MPDTPLMPQQTEGCSGAEVVSICQEAALLTMKEDISAPFVSCSRVVVTKLVNKRVERYRTARSSLQQKQ